MDDPTLAGRSQQQIIDGAGDKIRSLLDVDRWRNGLTRRVEQIEFRTRQAIGANARTGLCGPIEATQALHFARSFVETDALRIARRYSPYRWLWYLRRLPSFIFKGTYRTIGAYDAALAELLSARSDSASPFRTVEGGAVSYRIKNDVIEVLMDYCVCIRLLSRIHANLRWAGKSAPINFDQSVAGSAEPNRDLERAVEIYDTRAEEDGSFLGRVGTTAANTNELGPDAVLIVHRMSERVGPLLLRPGAEAVGRSCFAPQFFSLSSLASLNSDPRIRPQWWEPHLPLLALLLRVSLDLGFRSKFGFAGIQMFGYRITERSEFLESAAGQWQEACDMVSRIFPGAALPANPDELLNEAQKAIGSAWPLRPGPSIRTEGSLVCLDAYTAAQQFYTTLEFPNDTGDVANARSAHFEVGVQAVIDETKWRPNEDLREFIGREIRFEGCTLTDLDALGELNDSLLVVSCKSKIYSAQYDAGEFTVVRSQASAVEKAVSELHDVIQTIRAHPLGDNYDFRRFATVLGVVVVPRVIYVASGPALDFVVDGLRAAVSARELREWLNRIHPQ